MDKTKLNVEELKKTIHHQYWNNLILNFLFFNSVPFAKRIRAMIITKFNKNWDSWNE